MEKVGKHLFALLASSNRAGGTRGARNSYNENILLVIPTLFRTNPIMVALVSLESDIVRRIWRGKVCVACSENAWPPTSVKLEVEMLFSASLISQQDAFSS